MINETINITNLTMSAELYQFQQQQGHIITYTSILDTFSKTFVFRMELQAIAFFSMMLFLQFYTKQLEIEYMQKEKLKGIVIRAYRDRVLMFLSDVLFLPSVAFILIFISAETGWF